MRFGPVRRWFALALILCGLGAAHAEDDPSRERARVHTELGAAYYSRGQFAVALDELAIAVDADSHFAPAYNVLGLVYMELGETDSARQSFERALSLNGRDPDTLNNYGWFLCQNDRAKESISYFVTALKDKLFNNRNKALFNAGICSLRAGDDASAEGFLEELQRAEPRFAPVLAYQAEVYFKRGDLKQARTLLRQYMQRVGNPSVESLMLGYRLESKAGNQTAADDYAFMLLKRYPTSPEAQELRERRTHD